MSGKRGFWLQCPVGMSLVAAAFGGGWLAYGRSHNATRKCSITVAAPYRIPSELEPVGLPATPATAGFSAGDRVDVMVVIDDEPEPLILDALVICNTKKDLGLLVQIGGVSLLHYVRQQQMELAYRPSIVPSEAEYTSALRDAQIKFERLQADGKVKL